MENTQSRFGWLTSLGQFAAWVVTSIVVILDALYIREAILAVLRTLQVVELQLFHKQGGVGLDFQYGYGLTLFDDVLLLILGCTVLAVVILSEVYYRKGRAMGLLWKRVGKVLIIEISLLALMALIVLYI